MKKVILAFLLSFMMIHEIDAGYIPSMPNMFKGINFSQLTDNKYIFWTGATLMGIGAVAAGLKAYDRWYYQSLYALENFAHQQLAEFINNSDKNFTSPDNSFGKFKLNTTFSKDESLRICSFNFLITRDEKKKMQLIVTTDRTVKSEKKNNILVKRITYKDIQQGPGLFKELFNNKLQLLKAWYDSF